LIRNFEFWALPIKIDRISGFSGFTRYIEKYVNHGRMKNVCLKPYSLMSSTLIAKHPSSTLLAQIRLEMRGMLLLY